MSNNAVLTSTNEGGFADETSTPMTSAVVRDEFDGGIGGYTTTFTRLLSLLRKDEDDEEYVVPSDTAFSRAAEELERAGFAMLEGHGEFPGGYVTTDENGGIRIEWWYKRSRCVHLVIHGTDSSRDYVFVKLSDSDGIVERPVRPARLAARLTRIQAMRLQNP